MTFRIKRKSKSRKVYKRNKTKRKRSTRRKYLNRRRVTRSKKGGMYQQPKKQNTRTDEYVRQSQIYERDQRAILRNQRTKERIEAEKARIEAEKARAAPSMDLLKNGKRQGFDEFCINGPDYLYNEDYKKLSEYYSTLSKKSPVKKQIKDLLDPEKINNRSGKLRCETGFYVFEELQGTVSPEKIDKLLKFVIVKMEGTENYMILWSYANMLNYDYADEYFKKWIDYTPSSEISIRSSPKEVVLITREIIKIIEQMYGRLLVNNNLLLTKSYASDTYNRIINEFFSREGNDMANTVFICPIYEIPHSAIANHYEGVELEKTRDTGEIAIYAGLEGVFYHHDPHDTLYFVIGNLSGHYKTPKSRMEFVKEILEQYGYANIRIIEDPLPPSNPSSMESDDSDVPREEYRRFITNDNNITTFEAALARLNEANTDPVQVPVMPAYSQETDDDI